MIALSVIVEGRCASLSLLRMLAAQNEKVPDQLRPSSISLFRRLLLNAVWNIPSLPRMRMFFVFALGLAATVPSL